MGDEFRYAIAKRSAELAGFTLDYASPCPECRGVRASDGKIEFCVYPKCGRFSQEREITPKIEYHLEFVPEGNTIRVRYPDDQEFGRLFREADGFYGFDFTVRMGPEYPEGIPPKGYFEAWIFRDIANKLDELNAPWQREVERAMSQIKE